MAVYPFNDVRLWMRPCSIMTACVWQETASVPNFHAIFAALHRVRTADDGYQREHTLGYSRLVRKPDGGLDWERIDGEPVFYANVESAAERDALNRRLRAERPEVLGYRAHTHAQAARASKPRGDPELARIVRRLAKRDATAKELWPSLLDELDTAGCRPEKHEGSEPRQWRVDYIDTGARGRHVTLDGLARMLRKNRKTQ